MTWKHEASKFWKNGAEKCAQSGGLTQTFNQKNAIFKEVIC